MDHLPTEQLVALAGVLIGYVGRIFTKEVTIEARLLQLEKDMNAAHKKLRGDDVNNKS